MATAMATEFQKFRKLKSRKTGTQKIENKRQSAKAKTCHKMAYVTRTLRVILMKEHELRKISIKFLCHIIFGFVWHCSFEEPNHDCLCVYPRYIVISVGFGKTQRKPTKMEKEAKEANGKKK